MKILEITGIFLIILGIVIFVIGRFWGVLGKLPGDVYYSKDNFTFIFPITTSIVISIVLTILINLILFFLSGKK
ncbi:MAG: DUF2905 domain-containing protein [bacterium]